MVKISVIIPCYNAGNYIEKCLQALEKQSFQDFEVILVDDCSADHTADVIRAFAQRSGLKIMLLQNDVNSGPALSRNRGIAASNGEFVCFCDSDDWYEPDYLQLLYRKSQEEKAEMVIANYYTVSAQGQKNEKILGQRETLSAAQALAKKQAEEEAANADPEIDALVAARTEAKKAKNFAEADRIRDELKARGIEIIDTPQGAKWRKV